MASLNSGSRGKLSRNHSSSSPRVRPGPYGPSSACAIDARARVPTSSSTRVSAVNRVIRHLLVDDVYGDHTKVVPNVRRSTLAREVR